MTTIQLDVRIESTDLPSRHVWWASTDAVPGYFASASTLYELKSQALAALRDILGEEIDLQPEIADPFLGLTDRPFVTSLDDEKESLGSNPTRSVLVPS